MVMFTVALRQLLDRRAQAEVAELFGTVDWDDELDYKTARRRSNELRS
jgi:hypothetical protein